MPVRIPKPPPPARVEPEKPRQPDGITLEQVTALIQAQNAQWQARLDAMAASLRAEFSKPAKRKPSRIEFDFDSSGQPTSARIIPEN